MKYLIVSSYEGMCIRKHTVMDITTTCVLYSRCAFAFVRNCILHIKLCVNALTLIIQFSQCTSVVTNGSIAHCTSRQPQPYEIISNKSVSNGGTNQSQGSTFVRTPDVSLRSIHLGCEVEFVPHMVMLAGSSDFKSSLLLL